MDRFSPLIHGACGVEIVNEKRPRMPFIAFLAELPMQKRERCPERRLVYRPRATLDHSVHRGERGRWCAQSTLAPSLRWLEGLDLLNVKQTNQGRSFVDVAVRRWRDAHGNAADTDHDHVGMVDVIGLSGGRGDPERGERP